MDTEKPIRVLMLADVHAGDVMGLVKRPKTKVQRYMVRVWGLVCEEVRRLQGEVPVAAVLFVGDVVQGTNPKGAGLGSAQVEHLAQVDEWMESWEQMVGVVGRVPVYVVTGTRYHVGAQYEADRYFVRCLEAIGHEVRGDPYTGQPMWYWLHLDVDGVKIDVAHHVSAMIAYQLTALEREILHMRQRGAVDDIIVRAHVHIPGYVFIHQRHGVLLPSLVPAQYYAITSRTPNRHWTTQLGAAVMDVYPERKRQGRHDFVDVKFLLYDTPKIAYSQVSRMGGEQ